MITIHDAKASDTSTLGLGALAPSECVVRERAGGMYELRIVHPITDDGRHHRIKPMRIIKAPAPVRETPLVKIDQYGSVERKIYRVSTNGGRLNMRTGPGMGYRIIHAYRLGTEVVKLGESGDWTQVAILKGGAAGWMSTGYLRYVRTETETVISDSPGIVQPRQTREQLFRVYRCSPDTKERAVTAEARHITYDLAGAIVDGEYSPENIPANEVCAQIMAKADHDVSDFHIYCTVTEPVSGSYGGRNIIDCLLDPETGVAAQTKARVIRDNYDIFILPDEARSRGVELRYGKNLLSAYMDTDSTNTLTRIKPVGKTAKGEKLYIEENGGWVESPYISEYPVVYSKEVEYDVAESRELPIKEARELLKQKAEADFIAGCDMATVRLDADFVRLDLTEEYRHLANAYALHLYDSVPVIDREAGIEADARMTEYAYDAILDEYRDTGLGDLNEVRATIYGYELAQNSVSGGKLIPNTVHGDRLQSHTVAYAKFDLAAIDQLAANALVAVTAEIERLAAGEITTDELYAALAKIAVAQITAANIENANIQWAEIESLAAKMAEIASAQIGTAEIDYAKIVDMVSRTAIFTTGEAGQLYVSRLVVTEANMAQLTVGKLMLKDAEGNFVQLLVDADGNVTTQLVKVEGGNIADSTVSGGNLIENTITARELNVAQIFADEALIRAIRAANIDVSDLFAAEATVNELESFIVRASTIEALKGQLSVWADEKITLGVRAGVSGGGQLLKDTKGMTVGYSVSTWQTGENRTREEGADGFAEIAWDVTGRTEAEWPAVLSPVTRLPDGWQGRRAVLSAWVYSENWSTLDGGMYWAVSLSMGERVRVRYAMPVIIKQNGELGETVIGEKPENGKWTRLSVPVEFSEAGMAGDGALDEATHVYAGFYVVKNGSIRIKSAKLEFGTEATGWTPYPEEFTAGSAVKITEEEVRLVSKRTLIAVPSEDGERTAAQFDGDGLTAGVINSPSVAARYDGPIMLTVDPAATDANVSAGTHFRALADALASINARQIDQVVSISAAAGMEEYGDLILNGICGKGRLIIYGGGAKLHGTLRIRQCTVETEIYRLDVATNANSLYAGYDVQSNAYVLIDGCTISGPMEGVRVSRGGNAEVTNCVFLQTADRAVGVYHIGRCHLENNVGSGKATAYRSLMTAAGTVPLGGVEYIETFRPENVDELIPTAAPVETPESGEATTKTYLPTHSDSYRRGWSYFDDDDIRQGYNGYPVYGTMWFDTAQMWADLAGKTVKQASIGLYMQTGVGRGVSVTVELWGGTREYEGRTAAPEDMVSYGVIGVANPGQMNEMTIPTAAINDLVSGKTNVLALLSSDEELYKGREYSRNYARFDGQTSGTGETKARLTVTAVGAADGEDEKAEITVDADGHAILTGATLTVDADGNATITGATLTVDADGNAILT